MALGNHGPAGLQVGEGLHTALLRDIARMMSGHRWRRNDQGARICGSHCIRCGMVNHDGWSTTAIDPDPDPDLDLDLGLGLCLGLHM